MSEPYDSNPFGPAEPPTSGGNGSLPPYLPPQVAFTQPVEFVAGTCIKAVAGPCGTTDPLAS